MRIYLAATYGGLKKQTREEFITKARPKYILQTFFEGEKKCKECLATVGRENFLLDSGAFSFMNGAKCTRKDLEEYLDAYINLINENDVKYFFELDVDTIFGTPYAEELRRKLESRTGKQSIPVWHKCRGVDYWKKMVDEYNYIAIGGLVFHVKKAEWGSIKKMVDYAAARGVKVHGLGFTKTNILDEWNFYSVDSASWSKGAGRGQQRQDFDGRKIVQHRIDGNGKKIDLDKLALHNGIQWCKYQRYMDERK